MPDSQAKSDREATQMFTLRNILTNHCQERLTPELIDKISEEMREEIQSGPTSWAFK